jgi:ribosomal protein L32
MSGHGLTKADYKRIRREEKKALKKATYEAPVTQERSKKGRICKHCGHWIQKREVFYQGKSMGMPYIHVRVGWKRPEAFTKFVDEMDHVAEPRPIPAQD